MGDPADFERHPVLINRGWTTRIADQCTTIWIYIKSPESTNLILAVSTVAIAVFTALTYQIVLGSTEDTKRLITAAEKQAVSADKISSAADRFTLSAQGMEVHMKDAAASMQDSVDTASENTKTTIRNSQNAFRAEQRAWVRVLDAATKEFSEEKGFAAVVALFNSGRTPARNVQISSRFILSPVPVTGPTPDQVKALLFRPAQSIAPEGRYNLTFGQKFAGEITTPEQSMGNQALISRFQEIKSEKLSLYLFGILKYDDVFGNHRETRYRIFLADPGSKNIGFCDAFNDLN